MLTDRARACPQLPHGGTANTQAVLRLRDHCKIACWKRGPSKPKKINEHTNGGTHDPVASNISWCGWVELAGEYLGRIGHVAQLDGDPVNRFAPFGHGACVVPKTLLDDNVAL